MTGILSNSQIGLYYDLRNICLILFGVLAAVSMIYGIRVKIFVIMQKYFGIERKREIARMQSGKSSRKTSSRIKMIQQSGKGAVSEAMPAKVGIDVSQVTTVKLQMQQGVQSPEVQPEATVWGDIQETMVLDSQSETMVLDTKQETLVLSPDDNTGFQNGKNVVIVHGEDIY